SVFRIVTMFFFSSRRRHTRSKRDWSSDVCSSDLESEDSKTYWKRMNSGFDHLRKNHKDGETVLLVCHGSTIASLADKYGDNINVGENYPQNGSITKLKVTENDIEIEEYNKID